MSCVKTDSSPSAGISELAISPGSRKTQIWPIGFNFVYECQRNFRITDLSPSGGGVMGLVVSLGNLKIQTWAIKFNFVCEGSDLD